MIRPDERGYPIALPLPDLRFTRFAQLFSPDDQDHEPTVWRLGAALFDEVDLQVKASISPDARDRITALRRHANLSTWLKSAVRSTVESDLRSDPNTRASCKIFTMLTGHQIVRAVDTALAEGDFNLASLISQVGGDPDFRADVGSQLRKWKEQHIDAHIDESYRKIYSLLAGIVDVLPASKSSDPVEKCRELAIAEGLDWKRTFGLHLWYGIGIDTPYVDALESYRSAKPGIANRPLPWYRESHDRSGSVHSWNVTVQENDGLFQLISLSANPVAPLEGVLPPRSFSPSPFDSRLPWHISILLSRCLNFRDFADRVTEDMSIGRDSPRHRSLSLNANKVAISYAFQLESQGLWEHAVFVLLHLERSIEYVPLWLSAFQLNHNSLRSRETAIKEMIARHVEYLTDKTEQFLRDQLKIPGSWIYEAKVCDFHWANLFVLNPILLEAILCQYHGKVFDAYKSYIRAGKPQIAHDVALDELAPEAVLRDDYELLKSLFVTFDPNDIKDWSFRGRVSL